MTNHKRQYKQLSPYQYQMLEHFNRTTMLSRDKVAALKQTTFRSFGIRGYVKRVGSTYRVTETAREMLRFFNDADIYRKVASNILTSYFETPAVKGRGRKVA